ncbi:MAG TPA: hypothetical protein VKB94_05155 [Rhizomicrobium sp.]|nr:hypothetical protein [Rhizomicrobium sp.]
MPHYIYESRLLKTITGPICGVDEAGRGPLAGPVVAAAVGFERCFIVLQSDDEGQDRRLVGGQTRLTDANGPTP